MSYTKSSRQVIPTPTTATTELHTATVTRATTHFTKILTPELMIAHRKGAYALVINSTYDNIPLEQLLGTINAKIATEEVLNNISATISAVPQS